MALNKQLFVTVTVVICVWCEKQKVSHTCCSWQVKHISVPVICDIKFWFVAYCHCHQEFLPFHFYCLPYYYSQYFDCQNSHLTESSLSVTLMMSAMVH